MRLNQTSQLALSWIGWMILFFAEKLTVNYIFIFNFTVLWCTDQLWFPRRPNSCYCTTHTINVPQRLTSTTGGRLLQQSQALQRSRQMEVYFKYGTHHILQQKKSVITHFVFYSIVRGRGASATLIQRAEKLTAMQHEWKHTHTKRGVTLIFSSRLVLMTHKCFQNYLVLASCLKLSGEEQCSLNNSEDSCWFCCCVMKILFPY